jgi:signal transduction histidine kinase
VDEVMKAHGGAVSVASEPGKGATFTLHFKA